MIFCFVSGTFGGYNQVLQPAFPPEKKNYISIKSDTAKKKSPPCHSIKLETLKPRNSPPLYKIRKPNKEALQGTCVTLLFYGVLICYFCSILLFSFMVSRCVQYYFVGVTCPFFLLGKPQWGLSLWRRWDTSHQGKHNESPQREDITEYMILTCVQFVVGW